jgi:two-component system sensor histidine kinase UhpB
MCQINCCNIEILAHDLAALDRRASSSIDRYWAMRIESLVAELSPLKIANAALRESDDRYRELAEHCRDVCWMADVSSGHLFYLNPAFESVFGLAPDLACDDPDGWRYIVHQQDRSLVNDCWQQVDSTFDGWDIEYRVVRPDGDVVWIHERAFPVGDLHGHAFRIAGISEDVSARREASDQMNRYRSRLQKLASELDVASDNERRRIAAGLHDDVGQNLALARIQLGQLGQHISADCSELLESTAELIQRTIDSTRELMFELNPPPLDELGLWPALEWLADKLKLQTGAGLQLQIDDHATNVEIGGEQASILFRVVRELLHNVVKHSGSKRAILRRFTTADDLAIQVEDFGRGFSPPVDILGVTGLGLFLARERMRSLNGSLDVQSRLGEGTTITVTVPLETAR